MQMETICFLLVEESFALGITERETGYGAGDDTLLWIVLDTPSTQMGIPEGNDTFAYYCAVLECQSGCCIPNRPWILEAVIQEVIPEVSRATEHAWYTLYGALCAESVVYTNTTHQPLYFRTNEPMESMCALNTVCKINVHCIPHLAYSEVNLNHYLLCSIASSVFPTMCSTVCCILPIE